MLNLEDRAGSVQRSWIIWAAVFALGVGAALYLRLLISGLDVSAPRTTLRLGESVQLTVTKKALLGTEPLAHPELTKYITNWESIAVVEPDDKVTAVGTWGATDESSNVIALNGKLEGTVSISVHAEGPGPSLDFVTDGKAANPGSASPCCTTPVELAEGQQVKFSISRRDAGHTNITRSSLGTRYTLFFGSGVPNDPNAAQIVGYGHGINPVTFRVDDEHGIISAPASIGKLNRFRVLVFARNADSVSWKEFVLVHSATQVSSKRQAR